MNPMQSPQARLAPHSGDSSPQEMPVDHRVNYLRDRLQALDGITVSDGREILRSISDAACAIDPSFSVSAEAISKPAMDISDTVSVLNRLALKVFYPRNETLAFSIDSAFLKVTPVKIDPATRREWNYLGRHASYAEGEWLQHALDPEGIISELRPVVPILPTLEIDGGLLLNRTLARSFAHTELEQLPKSSEAFQIVLNGYIQDAGVSPEQFMHTIAPLSTKLDMFQRFKDETYAELQSALLPRAADNLEPPCIVKRTSPIWAELNVITTGRALVAGTAIKTLGSELGKMIMTLEWSIANGATEGGNINFLRALHYHDQAAWSFHNCSSPEVLDGKFKDALQQKPILALLYGRAMGSILLFKSLGQVGWGTNAEEMIHLIMGIKDPKERLIRASSGLKTLYERNFYNDEERASNLARTDS